MDNTGEMKWWARLYQETSHNSPPDQYVDHLAVDYKNKMLVVAARTHGNNTKNFWNGDKLTYNPGAKGFKNGFSGTSGNIHISWLGKYGLDSGRIYNASWVAEYAEGAKLGTASQDPLLDGWADPNSGWPNLNTTRINSIETDHDGNVYITGIGRRTITTSNAYQKMVKPEAGKSCWNSFVRVYKSDLSTLIYSSLITGDWDIETGTGGDNTMLNFVLPTQNGLITGGISQVKDGTASGSPIPVTSNVPKWTSKERSEKSESAVIANFVF